MSIYSKNFESGSTFGQVIIRNQMPCFWDAVSHRTTHVAHLWPNALICRRIMCWKGSEWME